MVIGSNGLVSCLPATGSSIRYKNVIRNISDDEIEKFYNVKPIIASYKATYLPEGHYWQGVEMPMLIAEDIEKVFPHAVKYNSDGEVDNYDDHLIVSVHQQMLIDQRNEIKELKAKLKQLEDRITNSSK